MTSKGKFEYCATADNVRVAEYLTKIAEGLSTGSISLASQSEAINLAPAKTIRLAIAADGNPEKTKGSIVLEISWKALNGNHQPPLEISTSPAAVNGTTTES
jgi:amphi-Trp domain-containing protein